MREEKQYAVYIITNLYNTVLYVGMTNDLSRRVFEHVTGVHPRGFSKRYRLHKLVYYEVTSEVMSAINREKEIKGWLRRKKLALVTQFNPHWRDLAKELGLYQTE